MYNFLQVHSVYVLLMLIQVFEDLSHDPNMFLLINDRKLLETLSAPAALAIRNAKMASEMVEKNQENLSRIIN